MSRADELVEIELLELLQATFPEDQIHSEERGKIGEAGAFQWWIDPVDGTRNFIHGGPLYCISIGLCHREEPVAGVVYVPTQATTYHAIQGSGAYKNDTPINVSDVDSLDRALVSSGLPFKREGILRDIMANISAIIASGAGLRRTGSAVSICAGSPKESSTPCGNAKSTPGIPAPPP